MTPREFATIDAECRKRKPALFQLTEPDPPASPEQLAELERLLGIRLAGSYKDFLLRYGGGEFGLSTIFSANPDSEWYLWKKMSEVVRFLPRDLLPFSDDFAGGYYANKIRQGVCDDRVVYWNSDGGEGPTRYADVFEFVANLAYNRE